MQFGRKHLISIFVITLVLTSAFILEASPTWRINANNVAADASALNNAETNGDLQDKSTTETPSLNQSVPVAETPVEPSYWRGRDFERWAYPNRTVTLIQYMGPRFVRHYATGQFVELVFEDHYASEGYYLVQNAYIGLKIYANKTVMYNPDMEYVAVDSEYITVYVYDESVNTWKEINLLNPSLRVDASNATTMVVTRVLHSTVGRLEVTYVMRAGELMKYNIVFTSYSEVPAQFRVVQSFIGVHGNNVTYETEEGLRERLAFNASANFVTPYFRIDKADTPILNIYLSDLGHITEDSKWTSDIMQNVSLHAHDDRITAEISMGNFSLQSNESLIIDPLVTTLHILHNDDDRSVFEEVDEYNNREYGSPASTELFFGRHRQQIGYPWYDYTYRSFLRWPILIPDGAIVKNAYLNVCAAGGPNDYFIAKIRVLNSKDIGRFTDGNQTLYGFDVMNSVFEWNINESWTQGQWISNIDVTSNIGEFMARSDYALGSYMGLRIDEGTASSGENHYRKIYAYEAGVSKAPQLVITFEYPYDETFVEPLENWSFEDDSGWSADNLLLRMDEGLGTKAYDSGPYNNDGSIMAHHGTVSGATWVDGKYGKALSFDGDNDYVGVTDSASIRLTNALTVEAWFFVRSVKEHAGIYKGIAVWGRQYNFRIAIRSSSQHWTLGVCNTLNEHWWDSPTTAPLNTWVHVVLTADGSKARFYINGQFDSEINVPGPYDGFTGYPLKIGHGWNTYFDGVIDEVRIYNRALIASEVSNRFVGVDIRDGLMGEWRFDEGTGATAADTHLWTTGKYCGALEFDGIDDYVKVPNSASLNPTSITVMYWVKIDAIPTVQDGVRKENAYILQWNTAGQLRPHVYVDGTWRIAESGTGKVVTGVWQHHAMTYDENTHVLKGFINGQEVCSMTLSGLATYQIASSANDVYVGSNGVGTGEFLDGIIDEARITDNKVQTTVDGATYMHGKHSWRVEGPSSQEVVISQLLSSEVVEYIRNRKPNQNRGVAFSFWYKPDDALSNGEKNKAYAEIVYKVGWVWQTPVSGDTVKPDDKTKWWHAMVYKPQLPTNTEAVKVRIVGIPYSEVGFKAWMDLALLSVYYYDEDTNGPYGNATLTTSIYYSNAIPHPEFDGFVSLGFGIAATAKEGYSVAQLKDLTVELLPNNGSATTQYGRLVILYMTQGNSKNWTIRDLPHEYSTVVFDASHLSSALEQQKLAFKVAVSLALMPEPITKIGAATLIVTTAVGAYVSCWQERRVSTEHPLASGGTSYEVYETLDYSSHLGNNENDRIDTADATYYFDWRFGTRSDNVFAIKISATVQWAKWTGSTWDKNPAYKTDLSIVISIANYWQ